MILLPPSSRAVRLDKQKVRQMEACMDEQGAPSKTQTQKGSIKKVESGTDNLEEI